MVEIIPAIQKDVDWVATHLRDADRNEAIALGGRDPEDVVQFSHEQSEKSYIGLYEDEPFIVFGVSHFQDEVGCVWLVGTDKIHDARVGFLRVSHYWLNDLHENYPLLFNYVDARNTLHIRWLRWLGFTFINLHPEFGAGRLPFYEIVRIR